MIHSRCDVEHIYISQYTVTHITIHKSIRQHVSAYYKSLLCLLF